jgi:hypothetical protein
MKSVVKKTPADIDLGRHQHGTGRKTEMNCVQKTPHIQVKLKSQERNNTRVKKPAEFSELR